MDTAVGTASSIDSYKESLEKCLRLLKPKRVFEFGPGISTGIILKYPVKTIDTLEHAYKWHIKAKEAFSNEERVNLIYENDPREFIETIMFYSRMFGHYDLIFVDSIDRERVLGRAKRCLNDKGAVILHDAERGRYQEAIGKFKHKILEDSGHTVILTDNDNTFKILSASSV